MCVLSYGTIRQRMGQCSLLPMNRQELGEFNIICAIHDGENKTRNSVIFWYKGME